VTIAAVAASSTAAGAVVSNHVAANRVKTFKAGHDAFVEKNPVDVIDHVIK
jgi:hypothetical protein